ncbi:MAG: DNA-binding protein [Pseudomonadota bacterium]
MTKNLKDLTTSVIARQSALNNPFAIQKIEKEFKLDGILWNGNPVFLKSQVAALFDIDERTINRYLESSEDELKKNGYRVLRGDELNELKDFLVAQDIDVPSKTTQLGIFNFRSVLNLAMLLTESQKAREIRSRILDIAMDVIAQKSGGHTKYINQRDGDYLDASFQEENYRKKFTNALGKYVENFPFKYQNFTDRIYKSIFQEKATEYRKILNLHFKENVRDTMYSELLELISAYENGLAHLIEKKYNELGKQLNYSELKEVFDSFEDNKAFEPLINSARTKLASRDLTFRDALHHKLETYIKSISEADYEKFLGEKSKDLEERIKEDLAVYKRLKDR